MVSKITVTDYEKRYPKLANLLGGYFHQDWLHEYDWQSIEPTFEAVVRHYKAINPRTTIAQVTQELERLLMLSLSDAELSKVLDEMNCAYYPLGSGRTYRQWLESILVVLKEPEAHYTPSTV